MTIFSSQRILWPPENAGFKPITKYNEFVTSQSNVDVWVPKEGHRIVLMEIVVANIDAGKITLKGSNRGIFCKVPLQEGDTFDHAGSHPIWTGEIDEKIQLDLDVVANFFVTLNGHEDS